MEIICVMTMPDHLTIMTVPEFRNRCLTDKHSKKPLPEEEYQPGICLLGEVRDPKTVLRKNGGDNKSSLDQRLYGGMLGSEDHRLLALSIRDQLLQTAAEIGANLLVTTVSEYVPGDRRYPVAGYAFRMEKE